MPKGKRKRSPSASTKKVKQPFRKRRRTTFSSSSSSSTSTSIRPTTITSNNSTDTKVTDKESTGKHKKKWYVYVIQSMKTGKTYVGMTVDDLILRLRKHNGIIEGGAKSTRASRPFRTVMYVTGSRKWFTKIVALQLEWALQYYSKTKNFPRLQKTSKHLPISCLQRGYKVKNESWLGRINTLLSIFDTKTQFTSNAPLHDSIRKKKLKWKIHSDFKKVIGDEKMNQLLGWSRACMFWSSKMKFMSRRREQLIQNVLDEFKDKLDKQ
jgi:predicted GIY-YIG superfamily endonuclease